MATYLRWLCQSLPQHSGLVLEIANHLHNAGPADAPGCVAPLRRDQTTVPAQYGVGCDDGRDPSQQSAAQYLAPRGQAAPLVIGEPEALAMELFLEDSILLDQVVDRLRLMPVDPASERDEEQLERKEFGHCTRIIG